LNPTEHFGSDSVTMSFNLRIDTPLGKTFSVLREVRYQASSQVLAHGLKSRIPSIRSASLQSLLDRGTNHDFAAILTTIDNTSTSELDEIRLHASRMGEAIDGGLASTDPETRQRALWTIAKMELESHFSFLIDAVIHSDDPQQMVAIELTSLLVKSIGKRRESNKFEQDSARITLMFELARGLESYPEHRVQSMFDWWVSIAHQEDEMVLNLILNASEDEASQRLVHHLERSKNHESMEFVASLLWNKSSNPSLVSVAARRNDHAFVETLASVNHRLGPTKELKRNLNLPDVEYRFLSQETFDDKRISVAAKMTLVEMMTLRSVAVERILPRLSWILRNIDASHEEQVALVLDSQPALNTDIVVIALSDALDSPDIESSVPPPWKQAMRDAIEGIIDVYARAGSNLQRSIAHFFRDFKCERLLEKLQDWPTAHLMAYARLSRIADSKYIDILTLEMDANSPIRRQKGIKAAHLLGLDRAIEAMIVNKLDDPVDEVRIEAIKALADSPNRENAIALLSSFEMDSNSDLYEAAERSLMKLRGGL
jgi:hypothetical protein